MQNEMSTSNQPKPVPSLADCKELIGSLKGEVQIHGNILSTGVKWDAEDVVD